MENILYISCTKLLRIYLIKRVTKVYRNYHSISTIQKCNFRLIERKVFFFGRHVLSKYLHMRSLRKKATSPVCACAGAC